MRRRILLVEDSPDQIDMLRSELEVLGYTVIVATNGLTAVEAASEHLPDLIVMDMRLPTMDGFRATVEIKKNQKTKAIPVLAATANALPGDREKCLAAGCDDYIAKPFTHRQLGKAIDKFLNAR